MVHSELRIVKWDIVYPKTCNKIALLLYHRSLFVFLHGTVFDHPIYLHRHRFVLLESRDLNRGQVRQVDALGLNLAVYRGSDSGNVFVTDAYCPHLGANIAVGGRYDLKTSQ